MITWENYEEYMVMHADGELTPAQEQELMSFLYEHPDLQSELTAFTMTKMIPDEAETYGRKAALLRPVPAAEKPKVIAIPVWRRYAVAAGVAALLFASTYRLWTGAEHTGGEIASVVPVPAAPASVAPPVAATPQPAQAMAQVRPAHVVPDVPVPAQRPAGQATRPVRKPVNTIVHNNDVPAMAAVDIDRLPAAGVKELQATQKNIAPVVTNVPALAIQDREDDTEEEVAKGSLIDRLPISDTKRSGMKSLASDVANGYGKVNSIGQEIARSNVSVKLRNKQLIFSF
ncbi:hypothetical protein GCM10023093_30370 [Nemorincola caseinilytica]|uniref:Anti sigma-E protein RseA N-terminal domain-containing protein n=1 Tax=Nemorincola caseinilytica TaxID=2054315 RepID=A0ABP8NR30_9BACT